MFPITAAISAPIPPGMDFTAGLPAFLLLMAVLLVSALAIFHAAISARRSPEVRAERRAPRVREDSHPLAA